MIDRTRVTLADMSALGEDEGDSLVIDVSGNIVASGVTGGGSLEIQKSDVEKVTDTTIINFEGGVEVTDEGGGKATVTISGGAGGGEPDFSIWVPNAPPATPYSSGGTDDDEFDDETIDWGIWTEFDVAGTQTVDEDEYGVSMITTSSNHLQGIVQDIPGASEWSFTTYVQVGWSRANQHRAGILLIEDMGNLTTSDCFLFANYRGSSGFGWQGIYHSDYDTFVTEDFNVANTQETPFTQYLRFRIDSNGYWSFDFSVDGITWICNLFYDMTPRFAPEGIGVGHKFDHSSMYARFPFARFRDSVDLRQMLYGDRVNMWRAT